MSSYKRREKMKIEINKKMAGIILVVILIGCPSVWYVNDVYTKENTWTEKEMTGQLLNIILYNTFPNEELFVSFTDGQFLVITQNQFGTYSVLQSMYAQNVSMIIHIKYKENGYNKVYVESIQEVKNAT